MDAWAVVIAALIAAVPATLAALGGRKTRKQMDTGNGHTLGQAVARLEEMGWRHENRLDKIESVLNDLERGP